MKFIQIFFICSTLCFYKQGHELLGKMVDTMLPKNVKDNLGISVENVSSWADSIRRDRNYSWANDLHFIVTPDDPEKNYCNAEDIDTDERNLFTSLKNYTTRLFDKETRVEEDLKFFIHFYQDMFQPLHMSGIYRGGNKYDVDFFGRKANLHQVWDYLIIRNRANEYGGTDEYISHLLEMAKNIEPTNPFDLKYWIKRNNKLNCDFVYKDLSFNITEAYYEKNKIVIDYLLVFSSVNLKSILIDMYK